MIEFHEVANLFPLMTGEDFDGLKADIADNGLREPVWLHPDKSIVDGRNRYRACMELGIEPEYRYWDESKHGPLLEFVLSLNLHRRHLSSSQLGFVALEVEPLLAARAKARQANSTGGTMPQLRETIPEAEKGKAVDQAAKMVGTNGRYVQDAKRLQSEAPELADQVRAGGVSLPAAMRLMLQPATIDEWGTQETTQANGDRPHVANNSGNNEWYTPPDYIERARAVMGGIDLDPASSAIANQTVGATKYYSERDNGLDYEWCGRVWMNPPYAASLIKSFADKLAGHVVAGDVPEAIVLTNNATETAWFGVLAGVGSAVCFPSSRVRFLRPNGATGAPLQGQAIIYVGGNTAAFFEQFSEVGWCAEISKRF